MNSEKPNWSPRGGVLPDWRTAGGRPSAVRQVRTSPADCSPVSCRSPARQLTVGRCGLPVHAEQGCLLPYISCMLLSQMRWKIKRCLIFRIKVVFQVLSILMSLIYTKLYFEAMYRKIFFWVPPSFKPVILLSVDLMSISETTTVDHWFWVC